MSSARVRSRPAARAGALFSPPTTVSIFNRQRRYKLNRAGLVKFAAALLNATGSDGKELHVTFLNDAQMQELNKETFGKDKTTNVISFPLGGVPGVESPMLGDVIVSVDTAVREAKDAAMPAEQRLAELVIHGLLHILGYDHVDVPDAERRRMQRAEKSVYRKVAHLVPGGLLLGGYR